MTFQFEANVNIPRRRGQRSERADYGTARVKDKAFEAIRRLWEKRRQQGLKLKDVAGRIDADPGWVSKHLRGPGNWTLRTFGALVEGLEGEAEIDVFPIEEPADDRTNFDAYSEFGTVPVMRLGSFPEGEFTTVALPVVSVSISYKKLGA